MSDEKPVQLKRKVSSAAFSTDTELICVVHYDRSTDSEIRPLSNSQFDSILEAAVVRGQQVAEGHRLDAICGNIPLNSVRHFTVLTGGVTKTLQMFRAYEAGV